MTEKDVGSYYIDNFGSIYELSYLSRVPYVGLKNIRTDKIHRLNLTDPALDQYTKLIPEPQFQPEDEAATEA